MVVYIPETCRHREVVEAINEVLENGVTETSWPRETAVLVFEHLHTCVECATTFGELFEGPFLELVRPAMEENKHRSEVSL